MTDEERASYIWWREWWDRRRAEERREREAHEAELAAIVARADMLTRAGVEGGASPKWVVANESAAMIVPILRELWTAIDALERRTRPP